METTWDECMLCFMSPLGVLVFVSEVVAARRGGKDIFFKRVER